MGSFFILSIFSSSLLALSLNNEKELLGFFIMYMATLAWILSIVSMAKGILKERPKVFGTLLRILFFTVILFIGHEFMREKLFVALLNLPIQVIVFSWAAKKKKIII